MTPPLTPLMRAALDHLAAGHDLAYVRRYSQWWVRESDAGAPLMPPLGQAEDLTLVPTSVINGLVKRRLLKFTGPKRRVLAGANTKAHWRAELTPTGRGMLADQAEAAAQIAEQLLRKVSTASTE